MGKTVYNIPEKIFGGEWVTNLLGQVFFMENPK
jgi:hypothetical protein